MHKNKGSATVEASLGLFFFFLFFVVLMYFYQVMTLEMRVQSALEETVQLQSAYCVAGEIKKDDVSTLGCELSKAFAKTNMVRLLKVDYLNRSWIQNGALGISMSKSQLLEDGASIVLVAEYRIKVPLVPSLSYNVTQQASGRMWIGDDSGSSSSSGDGTESGKKSVYMTPSGTAYHLYKDCSYIDVKVTPVKKSELSKLRNASGGIYYPCECCKPSGNGTVYVTKYGTRYHTTAGCSAIERDVKCVEESEIGGRHICSKCKKRSEEST